MSPVTDKEILEYFRTGYEDVAFKLIVKAHGEKVYNIALFMINDEMLAEDATQDIFIRIFKGLPKFRGEAKLSTWIYRIVVNVCYDYLRKANRTTMENLNRISGEHVAGDDPVDPESNYIIKWQRNKVRNAVKDLTKNQRMATTLFYFHEKSYEEIANIMDQPMNTIKSHIHRAKAQLADTLIELRKEWK